VQLSPPDQPGHPGTTCGLADGLSLPGDAVVPDEPVNTSSK